MINKEIINATIASDPDSGSQQVKGIQSVFIQLAWTGGSVDDMTVKVQGSNDESTWTDLYMDNGGTLEQTTTLAASADGNHAIQFSDFIAPYLKVVIDKGTNATGTVVATLSSYEKESI